MNKYQKFLDTVEEEYLFETDGFSESLVKLIIELENDNITKSYTKTEWDGIVKLAEINPIPALLIPVFKSPNLPKEYFEKLYNLTEESTTDIIPFFSEQVPQTKVRDLFELYDFKLQDILDEFSDNFSQKTISDLCKQLSEDELNDINFTPYRYVKPDKLLSDKISDMIENKDNIYFKEEAPEKFLNAIINNENISEKIRNKAFSKGYNPNAIYKTTEQMQIELYKSYADAIFETENQDSDTMYNVRKSASMIQYRLSKNQLPECCQLDFINRLIKCSDIDSDKLNILTSIIQNTKEPFILRQALKIKHPDIVNIILLNRETITGDIQEEIATIKPFKEMAKHIIYSCFYKEPSANILKECLYLNDEYLNKALMVSQKVSIDNSLISRVYDKDKAELRYLKSLKDAVNGFSFPNSQKILCFAIKKLLDRDYAQHRYNVENCEALNNVNSLFAPHGWFAINKEEYIALKEWIIESKENFPSYKFITNRIEDILEDVYSVSWFVKKYPKIFIIKDIAKEKASALRCNTNCLGVLPCNKINCKELYNLSTEEMSEFINDLTKIDNQDLYKEIKSQIITVCNAPHLSQQNETFKRIYKLVDLFNFCNEKIIDIEKENLKNNDKNIV